MALFKISRGLKEKLPITKTSGHCWYTIDDSMFYIDYEDENGEVQRQALNAKDAETLTGASLVTILNSSDIEIPTSKAVLDAINKEVSQLKEVDATKVPITRTINGKALDADIVLTAEDIGIENLIQLETTPEDIIEWMCEENSIIPVASSNGEVYTTNDGKILII